MQHLGHDVRPIQENEVERWRELARGEHLEVDAVVWTRTGWDWRALGISVRAMHDLQLRFLEQCRQKGVPSIGVHLDRWMNLSREHEVYSEPFFRVSHLFTADGGHQQEWERLGINHTWMPPGVSEFECEPGDFRSELASDIAFIGSWGSYHKEWGHRFELVSWLRSTYGDRVRFWPEEGKPALRQKDLRDLLASTKVVVGDSCLVPKKDGSPMDFYSSDRCPEVIARGGALLVHPRVKGVTDGTLWTEGKHLACWDLWNWRELKEAVDFYVEHDDDRQWIVKQGQEHGLREHSYTVRMRQVLAEVFE